MRVLELFAGTRSIGKAFERSNPSHEVISVEWDKSFPDIDIYGDVYKLDPARLVEEYGKFDVLWASPDCTTYSVAAMGHHRKLIDGRLVPQTPYAKECDANNLKLFGFIKALKPTYFFIENPRAAMRKMGFWGGGDAKIHNHLLSIWRHTTETYRHLDEFPKSQFQAPLQTRSLLPRSRSQRVKDWNARIERT